MHVAIVTETWPPEVNGVALTVHGLVDGLRRLGHRVGVVRPQQPGVRAPDDVDSLLVRGAPLPRYPGLRIGMPAGRRLRARWRDERLAPQLRRARDRGFLRGPRASVLDRALNAVPHALADVDTGPAHLVHGDLWSGNAITDDAGALIGYIVNWEDVSERNRLEATVREIAANAVKVAGEFMRP